MGRSAALFSRMARASVYVMTSRKEGMPMVLLEAMGIGLPAVAYDCPTGPREIISGRRRRLVVPDGDEDALAARLIALMDDPPTRRRLGAAALREGRRTRWTAWPSAGRSCSSELAAAQAAMTPPTPGESPSRRVSGPPHGTHAEASYRTPPA